MKGTANVTKAAKKCKAGASVTTKNRKKALEKDSDDETPQKNNDAEKIPGNVGGASLIDGDIEENVLFKSIMAEDKVHKELTINMITALGNSQNETNNLLRNMTAVLQQGFHQQRQQQHYPPEYPANDVGTPSPFALRTLHNT